MYLFLFFITFYFILFIYYIFIFYYILFNFFFSFFFYNFFYTVTFSWIVKHLNIIVLKNKKLKHFFMNHLVLFCIKSVFWGKSHKTNVSKQKLIIYFYLLFSIIFVCSFCHLILRLNVSFVYFSWDSPVHVEYLTFIRIKCEFGQNGRKN